MNSFLKSECMCWQLFTLKIFHGAFPVFWGLWAVVAIESIENLRDFARFSHQCTTKCLQASSERLHVQKALYISTPILAQVLWDHCRACLSMSFAELAVVTHFYQGLPDFFVLPSWHWKHLVVQTSSVCLDLCWFRASLRRISRRTQISYTHPSYSPRGSLRSCSPWLDRQDIASKHTHAARFPQWLRRTLQPTKMVRGMFNPSSNHWWKYKFIHRYKPWSSWRALQTYSPVLCSI